MMVQDRITKRNSENRTACRANGAHRETPAEALLGKRNRDLEEQIALLKEERLRHRRSLNEAAQVQRKLIAPRLLRLGPFEVASEVFPVEPICGDFVTTFEADGKIVVAIGDILGKGLHAGMWFTHLVGLLRIFVPTLPDPAAVVAAINSHVAGLQPEPPITTMFIGQMDARSGELTYCNAGHPVPVLVRANGEVARLSMGGPVMGAVAGVSYVTGTITLGAADTLVGYSDGLVECRNARGEDFGVERVAAAVRDTARGSADEVLFSVLGAAQDFAASEPCADDLALLVVHRAREHAS
jgi:serine phosphatase RsbU (regulator of sigma subunit)